MKSSKPFCKNDLEGISRFRKTCPCHRGETQPLLGCATSKTYPRARPTGRAFFIARQTCWAFDFCLMEWGNKFIQGIKRWAFMIREGEGNAVNLRDSVRIFAWCFVFLGIEGYPVRALIAKLIVFKLLLITKWTLVCAPNILILHGHRE
jgi:hypothetical protein